MLVYCVGGGPCAQAGPTRNTCSCFVTAATSTTPATVASTLGGKDNTYRVFCRLELRHGGCLVVACVVDGGHGDGGCVFGWLRPSQGGPDRPSVAPSRRFVFRTVFLGRVEGGDGGRELDGGDRGGLVEKQNSTEAERAPGGGRGEGEGGRERQSGKAGGGGERAKLSILDWLSTENKPKKKGTKTERKGRGR